ncbi:hypothetical protein [Marinobacterium rhizophilum]|uniref:Uncharacterized protein n=1 Tax=Marinobacterium rhizophilum TaxID=420402 RepID=A0ABY5HRH0_9GAMM|nr:hypothetical protein [Marinobacterium rhizophilum]UTW13804.1 hypothetical protein KDW95_09275 [Marinobacterium rhizophilum]
MPAHLMSVASKVAIIGGCFLVSHVSASVKGIFWQRPVLYHLVLNIQVSIVYVRFAIPSIALACALSGLFGVSAHDIAVGVGAPDPAGFVYGA